MSYNPDPIFRDGLNGYRKPAPSSAWERIESGLDSKRRKSVWLKVAAGLCLLMATSIVFWQYDQTNTAETEVAVGSQQSAVGSRQSAVGSQQSAFDSLHPPQLNAIVERSRNNHSEAVHEDLPVVERSRNEHGRSSRQSAVSSEQSSVSSPQLAISSTKSVNTSDEAQLITLTEHEEIITEPTPLISIEGPVNEVILEQKGTSITYTAEQVNSKFIKKNVPTQATPEKKNASGLQKVIDKALVLTNEGAVFGELRDKKNEWLSFNNLSNKTETNK